MSDNDLIRRGDALEALDWRDIYGRNAQAAVEAIPAVQPTVKQQVAGNGFTIKPLVWQFEQEDVQVADTSARHQYRIVFDRRATVGAWMWFCDGKWICLETEEAAKAAAQADYDARILSALGMQPTVSPEQPVATTDVAALVDALDRTTSHGQRSEYSRVGHHLNEASWHVHLAGFKSRDDAEAFLAAALARVKGVM